MKPILFTWTSLKASESSCGNRADQAMIQLWSWRISSLRTQAFLTNAEYRVPNWPVVPRNYAKALVPQEYIGREPIFPWEARV